MYRSYSTLSSTALMDFLRPTNNGSSISVNTTISLTGIIGRIVGMSSILLSFSMISIRSSISASAIFTPYIYIKTLNEKWLSVNFAFSV